MSKIAIVYMGGTFGCIGSPLYPMPADHFLTTLDQFILTEDVYYYSAPVIKDSSELCPVDWLELAQYILSLHNQFKHFILIHGTDTLSYAAAFLHHILQDDLHLIITGSQNPLLNSDGIGLHPHSDAWINLTYSIEKIRTQDKGVYISFNQKILSAQTAYKQNTTAFDAFLDHPLNTKNYLPQFTITAQHLEAAKNITILNYYLQPSSSQHQVKHLKLFTQEPPNILILQCFGSGNLGFSLELQQCLADLIKQGCWLIISTQVLFGTLSNIYATGSWLSKINAVYDPHYSQSDLFARAFLLYLQYGHDADWQKHWKQGISLCNDMPSA